METPKEKSKLRQNKTNRGTTIRQKQVNKEEATSAINHVFSGHTSERNIYPLQQFQLFVSNIRHKGIIKQRLFTQLV